MDIRPPQQRLSRPRIVDEAIALLRDEGLENVTLRRLAARLKVEAPSLYNHIRGKDELLGLVTVRLFSNQLDEIGPCVTWQEWLRQLGRVLWSTQTRIPDSGSLVATTAFTPDQIETMSDLAAAPLLAFGIAPIDARHMHLSVQAIILGFSALIEGPGTEAFTAEVRIEPLVAESIDALVRGWEAKLAP
ncbi:hypothetical protein GCM10011494_20230 [Novosphingobium endophyticum]|uniref:HTH tetR-type domain-containing protein n=1 Tax=Novosphingobium endophyticum TaxID=1955250 RepID=A0A916X5M5_9SPHN|nr:TetR family transcriptional regulator [Novosphingobium endophyticum]GGC01650.1 hypothetical protein GCM10011494_20230 [Novosphingobium endophyticum]